MYAYSYLGIQFFINFILLGIDLRVSCNENLHRWEEALEDYRIRGLNNQNDNYFVPRLRCFFELSNWNVVL